jgi:ferredoxin
MMSALQEQLAALRVTPKQIHTELFISPEIGAPLKAAPIGSGTYDCSFARSNKSAASQPGQTVLDTAEQNGVHIDYSCRQGFCGVCKVKLLEGAVSMAVEDGITPEEKVAGLVLACQAIPNSNVKIDA